MVEHITNYWLHYVWQQEYRIYCTILQSGNCCQNFLTDNANYWERCAVAKHIKSN
jgi:hypothetical protein